MRGLGGNLNEKTKETFAREVCWNFDLKSLPFLYYKTAI